MKVTTAILVVVLVGSYAVISAFPAQAVGDDDRVFAGLQNLQVLSKQAEGGTLRNVNSLLRRNLTEPKLNVLVIQKRKHGNAWRYFALVNLRRNTKFQTIEINANDYQKLLELADQTDQP